MQWGCRGNPTVWRLRCLQFTPFWEPSVWPVIHLANGPLHLSFLVVFALCYVDEPIRYVIMQIHLYSMKWIKPVSDAGRRTIGAFREKYGIVARHEKSR